MRMPRQHSGIEASQALSEYCAAQTGIAALAQCGQDLSCENIMRQATNLDLALQCSWLTFVSRDGDGLSGRQAPASAASDGKAWVPFVDPIAA